MASPGTGPRLADRLASAEADLRVFISSAFKDMAEERDRLVRRVFPELRRRCLADQVSICEIDLRWGITEEAARHGDVLRLCLAEIDRCFPFFIAILGEHYGWADPEAANRLEALAPHLLPYADRSITEIEIRHAVLDRPGPERPVCFFYFRACDDIISPSKPARSRLAALKRDILASGHPVKIGYADADALGEQVLEDLWAAIVARGGPDRKGPSWRGLLSPRVQGFVQRRVALRQVEDALAGRTHVLIHGEPGAGKTTLISQWVRDRTVAATGLETAILRLHTSFWARLKSRLTGRALAPEAAAVMFFAAAVDSTVRKTDQSWPLVAANVLAQVRALAGIEESIPSAFGMLPDTLGRWLALAAHRQPIILVLDGLEEVLGPSARVDWLPKAMPNGVTLFLSAASETIAERLSQYVWRCVALDPLSKREREALTRSYLAAYGKELSPAQQQEVLTLRQGSNPLYLRTLLDQMRETGRFETLSDQLAEFRDITNLTSLIERAFAALEAEIDNGRHDAGLTQRALALLLAARRGLAETEWRELLGDTAGRLPDQRWSPLLLMLDPYLVRAGGTLRFSSEQVREAAERRLPDLPATLRRARHTLVAYHARDPMAPRALEELPWLLATLEDWDGLAALVGRREVFMALVAKRPFDAVMLWSALGAHSAHCPERLYAAAFAVPADDPLLAVALARLLGDLGKADAALRLLGPLEPDLDDDIVAAAIQSQMAFLLETRRFAEAAPLAERQVHRCETAELRSRLGVALQTLAIVRIEQGRAEEALALMSRAEALHRERGNDRALAVALGVRAAALHRLGRTDEAMLAWRSQETQSRLVGDLRCLAASLGNQATRLAEAGRIEAAEPLATDQERLCRQISDRYGLQFALATQATLAAARDRFDDALAALDERFDVAVDLSDDAGQTAALLQRAELFLQMRDLRSAATLLAKAEARLAEPDHRPADIEASLARLRTEIPRWKSTDG